MELNWEMGSLHSVHENKEFMEIEKIEFSGEPLFLELIPREVHFYIFANFLTASELTSLSATCKVLTIANLPKLSQELNYVTSDDKLWKRTYIAKWLKVAEDPFITKHYPSSFKWKEMYQLREKVEFKYLQVNSSCATN
jgi:hypothetical protein